MKSQSNLIQDKIWVREIENGIRHITLRNNFQEKTVQHMEETKKIYEYDETNIYIIDRENIEDYVNVNFDVLFEQGLLQENKPNEPTIEDRIASLENAIVEVM